MNKPRKFQHRPLRIILRGPTYYVHGTRSGKRIRVATDARNMREANIARTNIEAEFDSGWRESEKGGDISWKDVAKWICGRQRESAKTRGLPFEIDAFDVYRAMEATGFKCAISGIPFTRRIGQNAGGPDPWGASIDRIENRQGYIQDNFRVVCHAANIAMNRWGYDTLLYLARSVVRSSEQVLCADLVLTRNTDKVII
jgi:hypothetical protein